MRVVSLVAALLCTGVLFQPAAHAQTTAASRQAAAASSGSLGLPVGGSHILRFDRPVGRVYLGNSDVADVIAVTDRSIYLLGKRIGTSSLTIMERGQHTPMATYTVHIGVDAIGLRRTLFEVMPHEALEVRLAGDGLVLSGAVTSAAAAERAVSIAERYAPERVVNSTTVSEAEQVMLEVRVAEVQRNALTALGITSAGAIWQNGFNSTLDPTDLLSGIVSPDAFATLQGVGVTGDYTLKAVFDALEERGVVTTLAQPTLVALSGETANFFAGGEFPIPVAVTDAGGIGQQISIEFKQFGVAVAFTPTVLGDTINLSVAPEVSALDRNNSIRLFGTEIPALTTRRAQTTVELRSGQSFAVAGLIRQDFTDGLSGFPGLARLPVLGALFRSTRFARQETEVVIIVTAHRAQPTTLDQLSLPTDLFEAPSEFQLFWMGQVEGRSQARPVAAQAQTIDPAPGRFDQNVGYVIQ